MPIELKAEVEMFYFLNVCYHSLNNKISGVAVLSSQYFDPSLLAGFNFFQIFRFLFLFFWTLD